MNKPMVDAKEAGEDIRAGLDDAELMRKYGVSAKGLQSLFTKLVAAGVIDEDEVERRNNVPDGEITLDLETYVGLKIEPEPKVVTAADERNIAVVSSDSDLIRFLDGLIDTDGGRLIVFDSEPPTEADLRESGADVALIDADTCGLEGVELIRALNDGLEPLPAVIVSKDGEDDFAVQAVEAGAFGPVAKPVHPRLLTRTLERAAEFAELTRFKEDHVLWMEKRIQEKTMEVIRDKNFLQGILNSSTLVSVILTDLDQNVLYWNSGAENIFGYTADEMRNAKITLLYPPDALTYETVKQLRAMVKSKHGTVHGKMKQIAKNGRVLTISMALSPMLDDAGELIGILGVGLDVTEEERRQKEILRLVKQLKNTQSVSIFSLAKLAESRDHETGSHLERIKNYCRVLAERLADHPDYVDSMDVRFIEHLVQSSVLHDIGKVAIPDSILMSPDKFGPAEIEQMKAHTIVGGKALEEAVKRLGEESFLSVGMEVAYYHHERWDGSGYPFGLKATDIPLSARIVAVADVYDALTTQRRYKKAFTHEEARSMIQQGRGAQFDPDLVDIFMDVEENFRAIRAAY